MPSDTSYVLNLIDSIIEMDRVSNLNILLMSLNNYLRADSIENKLEALQRIFTKYQGSTSEENNAAYFTLFSAILTNILGKNKTLSDDVINRLIEQLRHCLDTGFDHLVVNLFENETLSDIIFSDKFFNGIFTHFEDRPVIHEIIQQRRQMANAYVEDLLNHHLYTSAPTRTEREYIFSYLKYHCKTKKELLEFQSNFLKIIHDERKENQYFHDENKPYKTALGFILRITFPLLQCNNSSIINRFLEKPYHKLPSQQTRFPLPTKQPNRFWLFCQRHPYLVSFGIALGIVGLMVGGLATFGLLHVLLATPIIAATIFVLSQASLTGILSLIIKPISRHFAKTPALIPPDDKPNEPDLNFNLSASTTAMLNPLLSETVTFEEREAFDSSDDYVDQATELSLSAVAASSFTDKSAKPSRKYWVDVTKPAIIESWDDHTNMAKLIARFTIKPRTRTRKAKTIPLTESTPLLSK